jgi:hypothetical protein
MSLVEKPPVFLPDYMVEDWGIMPDPVIGHTWERAFNRRGYVLIKVDEGAFRG